MHLPDAQFVGEIVQADKRLIYEACYCSIFGECWPVSATSYGAEPVDAIRPGDDAFGE